MTYHEDVGYGILENSKSKGAALDEVCLVVLPTMTSLSLATVQERSCHGRHQACSEKLWQSSRKLFIR